MAQLNLNPSTFSKTYCSHLKFETEQIESKLLLVRKKKIEIYIL